MESLIKETLFIPVATKFHINFLTLAINLSIDSVSFSFKAFFDASTLANYSSRSLPGVGGLSGLASRSKQAEVPALGDGGLLPGSCLRLQ